MFLAKHSLAALVAVALSLPIIHASYANSCYDVSIGDGPGDQVVLYAECYNRAGQPVGTSINLNECIANYGGHLTCASDGGFGGSCDTNSCSLSGDVMTCNCGSGGGGYEYSSVTLGSCIENQNGVLECYGLT